MAEVDFRSAGALAELKREALSVSPVDGVAGRVVSIGSKLLEIVGFHGASTMTNVFLDMKSLAVGKDEANLIYFGDNLVGDISDLYRLHEELRHQFDKCVKSPEFNAAVANATLHITRTNVENRIKRLAHLITNGVKENDLELESLDDMMRAATELTDRDISILVKVAEVQAKTATFFPLTTGDGTINRPREVWKVLEGERFISPQNQMEIRVSLARLQSVGFGAEIQTTDSTWHPRFLVTPLGQRFIERIQEIAA